MYEFLKDIREYENNPRFNDEAVDKVINSIKEFGFKVPIVVDKSKVIIAGHTRYKASKKLGLEKVPVIIADDLTEEQVKAFRLADNKVAEFSYWNDDLLKLELDGLNLDMSDFGFELPDLDSWEESTEKKSISDEFLIPPISVFDCKQGYWQDRKREWLNLGIKSDVGRDENLLGGGLKQLAENIGAERLTGTSIFDPVLCEVIYKWFNVTNGSIYDCFAGGSVRGVVADKLGYKYTGIDLSERQIEANKQNAKELGLTPTWYCDDSLNADKYVKDESVDLIFSCPPYADLEVYSDKPNDISNMKYDDFKVAYKNIIDIACRKLKNDRFAVFVVGDVRDKKGYYRNFIDYTKECFNSNGLMTYNEIILLEQLGTVPLRIRRQFNGGRKVVKTHQNILVFYKGDVKKIKENYTSIEVGDIENG